MAEHLPKKRFGQNFLTDEFIIHHIINIINPQPSDHLVEIGPGLGAITLPLLQYVQRIDAIELDRDIIPRLEQKTKEKTNLTIHQLDALTLMLTQLTQQPHSLRIVGNLPYNISTPLLFHLLQQKNYIIDMHFMLQKEVADRLSAAPGSKQYGRLSIMAQYHCHIEPVLPVPPSAFSPAPKVHSTFIRLVPFDRKEKTKNLHLLEVVVKDAFSQRRKTLSNTLKHRITREQLISLDIDPNQRPEDISIEQFIAISNIIP